MISEKKMRVYVLGILIIVSSLLCHAFDEEDQEVKVVGDKNFNSATLIYDGIDVSNYQKDIDWRTTAKDPNIKYVYVKATEGATHRQHHYRRNIENARQHGIKVGSYHFMRTTTTIQSQFENFISVVKREEQDLVPLLDVETRDGWTIKQLQDSVLYFAQLLEEHFGCKPMIYTSSSYFNNYLGERFASYPLFIARYAKSEPQLKFGAKWILWQFSDRGSIDGIDALVDLSRFNRGFSVKDIAYNGGLKKKSRRDRPDVPRPKVRNHDKPEVPMSAKQRREMEANAKQKEKTEAQKRGEENQRKREQMEEKRRKEEAKREDEKRKEDEKRRKEIEKRQKELEKKHKEQEKKRKEEEKKKAQDKAREQAQQRMKAEKERAAELERNKQLQQEQQRKSELEKAKQERLAKQKKEEEAKKAAAAKAAASNKSTSSKTNNNQSSADNDEQNYNTRWQDKVKKK